MYRLIVVVFFYFRLFLFLDLRNLEVVLFLIFRSDSLVFIVFIFGGFKFSIVLVVFELVIDFELEKKLLYYFFDLVLILFIDVVFIRFVIFTVMN